MKTNLNAGPWKKIKEERKAERKHRYWKFQRGWDAFNQGEPIFAPSGWPEEDKRMYREGWEAAQRLARDFRNRA